MNIAGSDGLIQVAGAGMRVATISTVRAFGVAALCRVEDGGDHVDLSLSAADARRAERIVERVFRNYPGSMAVRLWDGRTLTFGSRARVCQLHWRNTERR